MTSNENNLALCLVRESYGEVAQSVASLLLKKNGYPFFLIAEDLKIENKKVTIAKILSILISQRLVEYKLNARQIVEYTFNVHNTLSRLKTARSVNLIKNLYDNGKDIEFIASELLIHGSLEMSSILLKLSAKKFTEPELKAKSGDLNQVFSVFNALITGFNKLAEDKFIERLPKLYETYPDRDCHMQSQENNKRPKQKLPQFLDKSEHETFFKYLVPSLSIDVQRVKKSIVKDTDTLTCSIREQNEDFGDSDIYWKLNEKKVFQIFRDQALIQALENRIDLNAGNILRVIFQLADAQILDRSTQNSYQSKPVTAIDIQRQMRIDYKMDQLIVDKYLSVILQDSFKVLEKIGDFSGGAYCIDFRKALTNLCLAHIESYIRERYDSKSLRIFRVIVEKSKLEQKQIEDFSMIPSKECKALVYNMLNDGLLSIIELSKTSDHAPSRTYYLFYVDVFHITKKLLENSYKAIKNLMIKREQLTTENKRLLEKNDKISNRVELLKSQGAEQSEIDYERSIMSSEEKVKLSSFTDHCKKIELAEIQLEETIFVFECFFYYNTTAPVIPTKASKD